MAKKKCQDHKALAREKLDQVKARDFSPEAFKPGDQGFLVEAFLLIKEIVEALEAIFSLLDND
jgi:hypothetical protein